MNLYSELTSKVPPPSNLVEVDMDWGKVESELGTMLPSAYKYFVNLYGRGRFDPLELVVWDLRFARPELEALVGEHDTVRQIDTPSIRFRDFRAAVEVRPWGEGIQSMLFWEQTGPPHDWTVVVSVTDGGGFVRYPDHTTGRFLTDLLLGRLAGAERLWSSDCFDYQQEFWPLNGPES